MTPKLACKIVFRHIFRRETMAEYPQGNQMIAFPANTATGSNMIPETMYFSGPFASEFPNAQRVNMPHNLNAQFMNSQNNNMIPSSSINAHHNMNASSNMNARPDISTHRNMGAQHNTISHHSMDVQHNINVQHNMDGVQRNMTAHHSVSAQSNINAHHSVNPQIAQNFGQNPMAGQSSMSGIDPRYLASYNDDSAQYIVSGQQIQRNATPINSFGSDYQNRSFSGIDRNKQKSFASHVSVESLRVDAIPKPQQRQMIPKSNVVDKQAHNYAGPPQKKPNELDLLGNDTQNQVMTRADKLKALYKSGPRAFSGPVEKVLKWHKSLQDIGVLVFYEIVAKCVSVRAGESCSKILVVRDDNGPAMQVVYYEIDFLLPELKPPCTIRVIGKMMTGTCRLQAFNVRLATGDDVATLARRAAVAAHHVAKLCKEYGNNVQ